MVPMMRNLGNVYICWSPFVISRTDAQNGVKLTSSLIDLIIDLISPLKLTETAEGNSKLRRQRSRVSEQHTDFATWRSQPYFFTLLPPPKEIAHNMKLSTNCF
jgi:hypothetical protein